jgi:hypothetical protein
MKKKHLQMKTTNSKLKQINGFIWKKQKKWKDNFVANFDTLSRS